MNFNPLLAVPGVLIYLIIIGARLRPYQPRVNKGLCNTPVHIAAASMLTVQTAAPKVLHQADLQNLMRLQVSDVVGCTRLLTVQGHIGCAADETDALLLPLFPHPRQYVSQKAAVLLPEAVLDSFLSGVNTNDTLRQLIQGVLVYPSGVVGSSSPAAKFPQAEFALYNDPDFQWNPVGQGLNLDAFDFPIFLLDNVTAVAALQKAADNVQHGDKGVSHQARLETQMSAKTNSSMCIRQQTCQPLGGHSIWGAAPPLPLPGDSASSQMPLVMLLASVDSDAFFRSDTVGAESAMGSLITLLAVADILGNNTAAVATYSKRLVLTALMGEPWGFMGSKRMLWEMYNKADSTSGLDVGNIDQMLEIGQVGKAGGETEQIYCFYAHSQKEATFGDTGDMIKAMQKANRRSGASVDLAPAAASNPGLPPASLSSFLRVNPSIQGVLLTDHSGPFVNQYYQSKRDTVDNIQAGSLAAAAVLAAQSAHDLAAGPDTPSLQIDNAVVHQTVSQLIDCLLRDSPGLQCALGQQLLGQHNTAKVEHYISVLRTVTEDSQDPAPDVKSSIERFIWQYLALRLQQPVSAESARACDPYTNPCPAGSMVCAGHLPGQEGSGQCVNATVKYVPSYSTHLECKDCAASSSFQWEETNSAAGWEELYGWPPDPMWTESNWPPGQPSLQLFQKESSAVAKGTLAAGVVTALVSLAAVLGAQVLYEKYAKHG